jgi:uncharacterized membrane protein YagU involved in acid resistance
MMTLTIGMLVTFAALVLGLITASVKAGCDDAVHYRQEYALQLTELEAPSPTRARTLGHTDASTMASEFEPSELFIHFCHEASFLVPKCLSNRFSASVQKRTE